MDGSCQCGAVRFKTPTPQPLIVYHCHCTNCRRQSASAFGTSAIFPAFSLPSDNPSISVYDNRATSSGKLAKCYFCNKCGSRIIHDRGLDRVSVKGGLLEGLKWDGAVHIWTKSAVVPIPEGVESWEGDTPRGTGQHGLTEQT